MAQSVVAPVVEEVRPKVAESVPAQAPEPKPVVEVKPVAEPTPSVEPVKEVNRELAQPTTAAPAKRSSATHSTLSGTSIASLLRGSYGAPEPTEEAPIEAVDRGIDPQAVAKLTAAREAIIEEIKRERPRFIVGFETMEFEGHKIKLTVPSEALRHDIAHASTELLFKIADISGVKGLLEFDITVKEDEVRKMRPIKLEDRMEHIEKRNPHYLELKKALDLDVE